MTARIIIAPGQRFGRLEALRPSASKGGLSQWVVRCECGTELIAAASKMHRGDKLSCGCLQRDMVRKHGAASGGQRSPEYSVWAKMRRRCSSKTDDRYADYGGRGIVVCARWQDSFENFYEDMGPRPNGTQLDRIDNDGNYEPGNCRWATRKVQQNNMRANRVLEFDGKRKTMSEWAGHIGVPYSLIQSRIQRGWPVGEALTSPNRKGWKRHQWKQVKVTSTPLSAETRVER